MPEAGTISGGLERIANDWRLLAVFWHAYFAALSSGLLLGYRPGRRLAAVLPGLPLLSVSVLAWLDANPFNSLFFAVTGLALILSPPSLKPAGSRAAGPGWKVPGLVLFALGWTYPHFLATSSFLPYLYAAPLGLIPCPTLLAVTGLVLIVTDPGFCKGKAILTVAGMFYGLFGALYLGVNLDWLLVGASLILLMHNIGRRGQANVTVP